jgi:ribosome modulation factor
MDDAYERHRERLNADDVYRRGYQAGVDGLDVTAANPWPAPDDRHFGFNDGWRIGAAVCRLQAQTPEIEHAIRHFMLHGDLPPEFA